MDRESFPTTLSLQEGRSLLGRSDQSRLPSGRIELMDGIVWRWVETHDTDDRLMR